MLKSFQASSRRPGDTPASVQKGFRTGLLTLAIASLSCFYSSLAAAVGLGEISLHSAMGQQLNADIELGETRGMTADDIVVGLASAQVFADAGVERVFFLNDLVFTPIVRGGSGVVHVTSRRAVTEPYLNFVVRLVRNNGDQLREYTLLLDPPNSAAGLAATRSRNESPAAFKSTDSRFPVAPPQADQGKHYSVTAIDTLGSIARRVRTPGSKMSAADMTAAIIALNPQALPNGEGSHLKVGQSLLLPDAATEPKVAIAPASPYTAPSIAPEPQAPASTPAAAADELVAKAVEEQQLSQTVDQLKQQVEQAAVDEADKAKRITELQTQLAEVKAANAPATPPVQKPDAIALAPVAPAPVAPPAPVEEEPLPWTTILAALAVVLLLLAFIWSTRRNRAKARLAVQPEPEVDPVEALFTPAQQPPVVPLIEVPIVTPRPVAAAAPVQRMAGASTDALDGASIYIAYGRFAEAVAILREAAQEHPDRTDVRLRILELLGEQGDLPGFNAQEQELLDLGIEPSTLAEIRQRYPKLNVQPAPLPADSAAPTTQGPVAAAVLATGLAGISGAVASASTHSQLDENAAAALNPEPEDEFQLNLDELSMDSDWDLVDPFENTPAQRKPAPEAEPELDPAFASNLTQLPEVFEIPDEQFLSDFPEEGESQAAKGSSADSLPEFEHELNLDMDIDLDMDLGSDMDLRMDLGSDTEFDLEPEIQAQAGSDQLTDEFLDSFMADDTEFDLLDLEETPISKINEAQVLIDDGRIEEARRLLQEVIDESDDGPQQTARDLLAGLG